MSSLPKNAGPAAKPQLWTWDYSALTVINLLTHAAFYGMMPILPLFLQDRMDISSWQAGLIIGGYGISSIVTRFACGFFLDAYGRKPVYLFALSCFTVLFVFYTAAASFWFMFITRILHGLAWGLAIPAGQTAVVDVIPFSRRGEGIGLYGMAMALGMALSPAVGLLVAGDNGNYDLIFILGAGLGAMNIFIALKVRYLPAPAERPPISMQNIFEVTSLPVGLTAFFGFMGYGTIMNWSAVIAAEIPGASASFSFLWMAVGTILSRLFSGRVYDQRGPGLVCAFGFIFLLATFVILTNASLAFWYYAAGVSLGISIGILMPVYLAMINTMVSLPHRGAANSTYAALYEGGIGTGIVLTGVLLPYIGLQGVFILYGLVVLITALCFFFLVLPYFEKRKLND